MIEALDTEFPANILKALQNSFSLIDPQVPVYLRPLKQSDGIQAIGIYPTTTGPDDSSQEIRGPATLGGQFPTIRRHTLHIMGMVIHTDPAQGVAQHATLAKRMWARVATDPALRVALSNLSSTDSGLVERAKRWKLGRTEYQSGELRGTLVYMSVTEFWLETELS